LKILYAAQLSENDSALYRLWALERLGHTVVPINSYEYEPQSALMRKIVHRAQMGPWVSQLNKHVLAMAERERPDVFWADKLLYEGHPVLRFACSAEGQQLRGL
jgi:spore maturation protein CgeB